MEGFSYTVPGVGTERIIAVCDAKVTGISCWKPDGSPDPDTAKKAVDFYSTDGNPNLELRYKRPTKLVVVGRRSFENPDGGYIEGGDLTTNLGYRCQYAATPVSDPKGEIVQFYYLYPKEEDRSVDVCSDFGVEIAPKGVSIRLVPGSSASIGSGLTLTITKIERGPYAPYDGAPISGGWHISYAIKGSLTTKLEVAGTPVTKRGVPITFIDARGNPVFPEPGKQIWSGPLMKNRTDGATGILSTPINPGKVDRVLLLAFLRRTLVFRNVPLTPKEQAR